MRGGRGFTLVETVVSLSLLGLCLALCLPFLRLQDEAWSRQEVLREEFGSLAGALSRIAADLHDAGYRCGGPPVQAVGTEAISYLMNRDGSDPSGFSVDNRRLVTVSRAGGDLMYRVQRWDSANSRWERGSSQKLASGLDGMLIEAYGKNGVPAVSPGEVRAVSITLRGRRTGALGTYVSLRNGRGGSIR